jgi:hypothetical protein
LIKDLIDLVAPAAGTAVAETDLAAQVERFGYWSFARNWPTQNFAENWTLTNWWKPARPKNRSSM